MLMYIKFVFLKENKRGLCTPLSKVILHIGAYRLPLKNWIKVSKIPPITAITIIGNHPGISAMALWVVWTAALALLSAATFALAAMLATIKKTTAIKIARKPNV